MNAIYRSSLYAVTGGLTIGNINNYNIMLIAKACEHDGEHQYDVTLISPGELHITQERTIESKK